MNAYETVFIVKASLTDEETAAVMEKIKGIIQREAGEVVVAENMGKRKLAYEVQKEKKGTYLIMQFKGNGATVLELERNYRLTESIIKFMTIRIDPKKLGKILHEKDEKPISMRDKEFVVGR